jgi:hypothetical protein
MPCNQASYKPVFLSKRHSPLTTPNRAFRPFSGPFLQKATFFPAKEQN